MINGGWNCSPNDVYICHGVTEALQIIFAAYLSNGDEVLAPGPHYPPYMAYPQPELFLKLRLYYLSLIHI